MLRLSFTLQIAVVLFFTGCADPDTGPAASDLLCENLMAPAGIGTATPSLSWKIHSSRNGASQTAYQILAAASEDLLSEDGCDLWNSGKVISSESVLVPYTGSELSSRSVCYWKVRIWDDNNVVSEWSDIAFFSVGLLDRADWKADYIGMPGGSHEGVSPQFRKTFSVENAGTPVFLHINSLGYHEVYLNGEKVGSDVLAPAVSQFNKRSLAVTRNITQFVRQGRNDMVIWAGRGWYSSGLPGVALNGPLIKAQVEQLIDGRWDVIVSTDTTWACRNSGYYTTGSWRPGQFGGERVDGALLLADMTSSSLGNVSWSRVYSTNEPDGEITPQMTEPNRITDTISPSVIRPLKEGEWLIDMGTNLTGWLKIGFPQMQPGQEVVMEYCDHLDLEGNFVNQRQTDTYIARGIGRESFCNKFNYHGFRYIKISNLKEEPQISDIKTFLIHTDYRITSSFECSDQELNKIHNMIQYTLRCLSVGGYLVDCPQFERLGYGGDGNASTETAQVMFNLAPLYSNWFQAWADCIRDDGSMPHTAPNPYSAGGGPYWCGFIITAAWKTYQNYGDKGPLEKYYPVMQKWLGFVERHSQAGLLRKWPETEYRSWYLGDWASPEGTDQTNERSVDLVNNCFIVTCYETMQKIAGILEKNNDAEKYEEKRSRLKDLIHREFYDGTAISYGSGTQIDITYPLLAGVVPDSLVSNVRKTLYDLIANEHNGHMACGLVGIPVFTEWAVKSRETDFMYPILKKKGYPGYLYMIDNGATTTWEHWNGDRSRIHNCYNGIGSWFYQAPGGIVPDDYSPGYRHFFIEPQIPEGITWANTLKETPYGTILVKWKAEGRRLEMEIQVPAGSTATLNIPEGIRDYKLNGRKYKNGATAIEIESGKHFFRSL